jgi:hypothetical protein
VKGNAGEELYRRECGFMCLWILHAWMDVRDVLGYLDGRAFA